MKIIDIFANEKLYAFHYEGEEDHELDRLLNSWTELEYLHKFLKANAKDIPSNKSPNQIFNEIQDNADEIEDLLIEIAESNERQFEEFFKALDNNEYKVLELSRQKGRKNYLRIYALRIDKNCFVITGGAIKFTHLMQDRKHTQLELNKIEMCRNYLKENGIIDADSFYEFLNQD